MISERTRVKMWAAVWIGGIWAVAILLTMLM